MDDGVGGVDGGDSCSPAGGGGGKVGEMWWRWEGNSVWAMEERERCVGIMICMGVGHIDHRGSEGTTREIHP